MNMRLLIAATVVFCCSDLEAGRCCVRSKCCPQTRTSCASGPTTKLWKGKDGKIREVISHWDALHRSVEAEQLEDELAGVRDELQKASADLVALREQAAAEKAALQKDIASLKQQLKKQTEVAAKAKHRAEVAEEAQKESQVEISSLKESEQRVRMMLASVQENLVQASSEVNSLKNANDKLQADVAKATAARNKAQKAAKAAKAEIKKMKQAAINSKKAEVATNADEKNPADDDSDAPAEDSEK